VAAAHVEAVERATAGACRALGGENAPQIRAFEIAHRLGLPRPPRRLPYWAAHGIGWIEEARARLTGRPPLVTRGAVRIFRYDWPLDSRAAAEALGYTSRPLESGIAAIVAEIGGGTVLRKTS
jgi:dihydroflavonol-4-reductase